MSFMLPGLGHLYGGNSMRGVAFFGAFTILNGGMATRPFVPLVVILSSWDAYRITPREVPEAAARRAAFLGVGFVGFLAWISMVWLSWTPIPNQMTINAAAERISRGVLDCASRLGRLPAALDECGDLGKRLSAGRDPWGTPYLYHVGEQGQFEIRSAGRDGKPGTADDLIYRYTFR